MGMELQVRIFCSFTGNSASKELGLLVRSLDSLSDKTYLTDLTSLSKYTTVSYSGFVEPAPGQWITNYLKGCPDAYSTLKTVSLYIAAKKAGSAMTTKS